MAQGGPLFRIAIDSELELVADVAETALPVISSGMRVEVEIPGIGDVLAGEVRMVAPEIDARTRLGKVHVTLPANDNVRAGNFASGTIELTRSQGVAVPQSAMMFRGGKAMLQVVNEGVIESREVETGIRDAGYIEISKGLRAAELVVYKAGTFVSNGDAVTPVEVEHAGVDQ